MQDTLREVTAENRDEIAALSVADDQRAYLDTPVLADFLRAASEHPTSRCCGIYNEHSVPVGFVSFGYGSEHPDRGWIALLLVDERHQRRGYGRAALDAALERMAEEIVGCRAIGLSYRPENLAAAELYRRVGFEATGIDGRGEVVAWLALREEV